MYGIESILMALFGGGCIDWDNLAETDYDWDNIFELLKERYGSLEDVEINDIYETILNMGKANFISMINKFIKDNKDSNNENVKRIVSKLQDFDFEDEENSWYIMANCLDSHIQLLVDDTELYDILNDYFADEIEKINDKIGFTYIAIIEN